MKSMRFCKPQLARRETTQKHPPAACAEINRDVEGIIYHKKSSKPAQNGPLYRRAITRDKISSGSAALMCGKARPFRVSLPHTCGYAADWGVAPKDQRNVEG